MKPWYSVNLGDAMLASGGLGHIEKLFLSEYAQAGMPVEMALFTRHESGELHCELVAYLSPLSVSVAHAVDAGPCARPSPEGLSLHAGSDACWEVLFRG